MTADTAAPVTVGDLITYLRQFPDWLRIFLDIDAAVQEGFADDYVEESFISLSYALGKLEAALSDSTQEPDEDFGDNMTWQDREIAAEAAKRFPPQHNDESPNA